MDLRRKSICDKISSPLNYLFAFIDVNTCKTTMSIITSETILARSHCTFIQINTFKTICKEYESVTIHDYEQS